MLSESGLFMVVTRQLDSGAVWEALGLAEAVVQVYTLMLKVTACQ